MSLLAYWPPTEKHHSPQLHILLLICHCSLPHSFCFAFRAPSSSHLHHRLTPDRTNQQRSVCVKNACYWSPRLTLLSLSLWFDNCCVRIAAALVCTGQTINYRSFSFSVSLCLQLSLKKSTHTQFALKEKTVQHRQNDGLRQIFNGQLWRRQQESGHHQVDYCHARKFFTIPTGALFLSLPINVSFDLSIIGSSVIPSNDHKLNCIPISLVV